MSNKTFIYKQIYNDLKEKIVSGEYTYGSILPSERVLSEQYGAWRTTVRQAMELLTADGLIEKKAGYGTRVIYGYDPSLAKDRTIGFFIADDMTSDLQTNQPYYSDLLYYLDIECKKNGCRFLFSTLNSQSDLSSILQHNFSLVVYLSHKNFDFLETLKERNIPTILLNEKYKDYPVLANDQFSSGFLAVRHVIEMGHRDIGIISGPMSHLTVRRRLAGCYLALAENDLTNPSGSLLQIGNWEYESGYECAKAMFTSDKQKKPTAVIAFNDIMAIGAMHALRDLGYSIPDDVSVIGSDNIRQLLYTEPALTTVDMKVQYTAQTIILVALKHLSIDLVPGTNIITPVELVIRNTVKNLNK